MQNLSEKQIKAKSLIFDTLQPFRRGPSGKLIFLSELPEAIARPVDVQEAFDVLFGEGGLWNDAIWDGGEGRVVYWLMDAAQDRCLIRKEGEEVEWQWRRKNGDSICERCAAWVQENRRVMVPEEVFTGIVEEVDLKAAEQHELNRRAEVILFGECGSFIVLVRQLGELGYLPWSKAKTLMNFARQNPEATRLFIDALFNGIVLAAQEKSDSNIERVDFICIFGNKCDHTNEEHRKLHGILASFLNIPGL